MVANGEVESHTVVWNVVLLMLAVTV
jgi:hypothetical protein